MKRTELEHEQAYVDGLYARLDEQRTTTADELARVRRSDTQGTHQNRSERDAFVALHVDRLRQLNAVEERICFGRLDLESGERRYIGRIGLSDDTHKQLLVDWRAPAAEDFYRATAAQPGDVVRRRHLASKGRDITSVEDEVLNTEAFEALGHEADESLVGDGVLINALNASRTGRMGDIVATIQAEQDAIVRSALNGVLVVQGGPGTGKTAVALHRAAYLLYTYREQLAKSGVLVVGPSPVFLRYIEQVLPSLGESGVVMSTVGELFPGLDTALADEPDVAALKGDARMADVIAAAVRRRQKCITAPETLDVEGVKIVLRPNAMERSLDRARRSHKPHNQARVTFVLSMLDHLADSYARALGQQLDREDRSDVIADLRGSKDVRRVLNLAWPPLTAQALLADLYARPDRLAAAAGSLTGAERKLLHRDRDAPWTVSDVPLLDEAAELLGVDDSAAKAVAARLARDRNQEIEFAKQALGSTSAAAAGMLTAEGLVDRFTDHGASLTLAERAYSDREWAYGHIVVDEAQELSPMTWRVLMRRCPRKSMTLVGDVAQTGSAAGTDSWAAVLDPYVEGRWRIEELTVNYRTPAPVMELAANVLKAAGITSTTPTSAREGEWPPIAVQIPAGDLDAVVQGVSDELELLGEGRLSVITPRATHRAIGQALTNAFGADRVAIGPESLDSVVAVLTVAEAKGLEFDAVVLVEPQQILGESVRGANDLYVALTRPTQRLRVLHSEPLKAGLEGLSPA